MELIEVLQQRTKDNHPEQFAGLTLRVEEILHHTPRHLNETTERPRYKKPRRDGEPNPETPFTYADQQVLLRRLAETTMTRREIRHAEREAYRSNHRIAHLGYTALSKVLRTVAGRS